MTKDITNHTHFSSHLIVTNSLQCRSKMHVIPNGMLVNTSRCSLLKCTTFRKDAKYMISMLDSKAIQLLNGNHIGGNSLSKRDDYFFQNSVHTHFSLNWDVALRCLIRCLHTASVLLCLATESVFSRHSREEVPAPVNLLLPAIVCLPDWEMLMWLRRCLPIGWFYNGGTFNKSDTTNHMMAK